MFLPGLFFQRYLRLQQLKLNYELVSASCESSSETQPEDQLVHN